MTEINEKKLTIIKRKGMGIPDRKQKEPENGEILDPEKATVKFIEKYVKNKDIIQDEINQIDLLAFDSEESYRNLSSERFIPFYEEGLPKAETTQTFIAQMISKDKEWVKKKRLEDDDKSNKAIIAERLFDPRVEKSFPKINIFGTDASFHKTTEFDDRSNRTDSVVKWESLSGIEGDDSDFLAIDFTTSDRDKEIIKKCSDINAKINSMKMTNIKYFDDNNGDVGPLIMIPRVVITVWSDRIEELCHDVHYNILVDNNMNMSIYIQIKQQLELQAKTINKLLNNQNRSYAGNKIKTLKEMEGKINSILSRINPLIKQRKSSHPQDEMRANEAIRKSGLERKYEKYYKVI